MHGQSTSSAPQEIAMSNQTDKKPAQQPQKQQDQTQPGKQQQQGQPQHKPEQHKTNPNQHGKA